MGNGRLLHDCLTPLQPLNSSRCVVFCCFSRFKSIYLAPLEITCICYFSLLDSVALIGYLDNGIFLTFCVQKWWIDCCYTFLFLFIICSVLHLTIRKTKVKKSNSMKRKLISVTFFTFAQISHIFPNSKHSFFLIYLL